MNNFILVLIIAISQTALADSLLKYDSVVDLSQYRGQTYFSVMQDVVKPALDQYAVEGFRIAKGSKAVSSLSKVDSKVASKALKAAGSEQNLKQVADLLAATGEPITFYNPPAALAEQGIGAGRFDLTTYLALFSGGGVAVKINAHNTAYNVNYGTGESESDEKTGRSFGEAPERLALDASDKHYLEILEKYVRGENESVEYFYKSILEVLLNSDTSKFKKISAEGQAVATDFLAVYTAEQNRHLMSQLKTHPWDESLLEVTLLSALHSGQDTVKLMFNGEFTDQTLRQASGCEDPSVRTPKKAGLIDYWQFSASVDPASCTRSGLNVRRKDFRNLGAALTAYELANNPTLVQNIQKHFSSGKNKNNVFAQLSEFLINYDTPKNLDGEALKLAADFTAFLMQVRADANHVSEFIVVQIPPK